MHALPPAIHAALFLFGATLKVEDGFSYSGPARRLVLTLDDGTRFLASDWADLVTDVEDHLAETADLAAL